ncbi:MAG: DUF1667 domain-containing protein [Clostridia bacterium]|nr:DUF1667 domain-containing protein [Clostridia bacterium]
MDVREMLCIGCPKGCQLSVTIPNGATPDQITVTGNTCKTGEEYARKEVTDPRRIVTSTVPVNNGKLLSVRTRTDIPKHQIMECMEILKGITVEAPVYIGEVIVSDIAGTKVDVIATKTIE